MRGRAIVGLIGLAVTTVSASPGAEAQGERAQFALAQCAAELGLTDAECACVMDEMTDDLSERQIDYFIVRIARNDVEVARMRTFMPLLERLAILFTAQRAVAICAPGKDIEMPRS